MTRTCARARRMALANSTRQREQTPSSLTWPTKARTWPKSAPWPSRLGAEAVSALVCALQAGDSSTRIAAAKALAPIESHEAIPALIHALERRTMRS